MPTQPEITAHVLQCESCKAPFLMEWWMTPYGPQARNMTVRPVRSPFSMVDMPPFRLIAKCPECNHIHGDPILEEK